MDVHILDRIWNDDGKCFIPTIEGWIKEPSGKYKALSFREGASHFKVGAITKLEKTKPPDSHVDCYFCPVQFTGVIRSIKEAVPELRVLWADLDDADPRIMSPKPTIAWHSSDHHYQALWILDDSLPTREIGALNKALSYHVKADKSGWDLTQLLRVPGSVNYKYGEPQECKLLWDDGPIWSPAILAKIVKVAEIPKTLELSTERIDDLIAGWKLNSRTRMLLHTKTVLVTDDRSERLWELEKLLVEAGLPVSLIVDIIRLTVWDKFKTRPEQLLIETLKAEKEFRLAKVPLTLVPEAVRVQSLLTVDGFLEMDIPAPDYMVEGFLVTSSVGMCAGEPKTMKSTLMLDMAIAVASGKPFLGLYKSKQCPVLYIQEENSESDIKRRFMRIEYNRRVLIRVLKLGYEPEPIPLFIMNNKGINLQNKDDREFMSKTVEDNGIKLMILDPWYMMCGSLNENDAGEVGEILKYLTTLRNRFGCTVMLVHHFKKGDASRGGQRMRGSSVFHSWIECGLYAELNKGRYGNILVEREFRAFPSNKDLGIVFSSEETGSLDYDVDVHDVSDGYVARMKAGEVPKEDVDMAEEVMELDLDTI